jgi:hypothetical protein
LGEWPRHCSPHFDRERVHTRPDSADPGLANVRSLAIGADHTGICKPADDRSDIYVS